MLNNNKLNEESEILNSKKAVNLSNPLIFKENIKNLVERIEVKTLSAEEIKRHNNMIAEYHNDADYVDIDITSKRDIIYRVQIEMFDFTTKYLFHVNNMRNSIEKIIQIERK